MRVLTANRLHDGAVVYRTAGGEWTHRFGEAARLDVSEAEAALQAALATPQAVVEAYLLEADESGPAGRERLRERIRAGGPTAGSSRDE